ncbi:MAG TPA: CmcJ/NvfI family oxidoreductase [Steroidobacteraceae bacterium]|nr:CmcJ/NvfI family oxidoreductase [Steroidobacteraceae bacterium]
MTEPAVHAELNYLAAMRERPQFHANDASLDRLVLDPRSVPIHDARSMDDPPTLAREGFELFEWPTQVVEFRDNAAVTHRYPSEIQEFVRALTGADAVVVTGPPILRFGERSSEAGTRDNSRAARLVHIDVSETAAAQFAAMATPADARPIRRSAQHNIWRTFSRPPQDVPLAVCDARTVNAADLVPADANFDRDGTIVRSFEALLLRYDPRHRWCFYSDMQRDEVIVFKRHDTDARQPHHVPHSAFSDARVAPGGEPRASVEMRTVAYWYA